MISNTFAARAAAAILSASAAACSTHGGGGYGPNMQHFIDVAVQDPYVQREIRRSTTEVLGGYNEPVARMGGAAAGAWARERARNAGRCHESSQESRQVYGDNRTGEVYRDDTYVTSNRYCDRSYTPRRGGGNYMSPNPNGFGH